MAQLTRKYVTLLALLVLCLGVILLRHAGDRPIYDPLTIAVERQGGHNTATVSTTGEVHVFINGYNSPVSDNKRKCILQRICVVGLTHALALFTNMASWVQSFAYALTTFMAIVY